MPKPDYEITFADMLTKLNWGSYWGRRKEPHLSTFSVWAARNEVVGLQVQVTANHDFVLLLDEANWLHPLGFCPRLRLDAKLPGFPEEAVEVFPVGYVEGDDRRYWMEYFDRAGYAEVPATRPQAVYIRVHVPAEQEPGIYNGRVRFYSQFGFEDEVLQWEGMFEVHVARVTLPEVKDYTFHLNLWQHCTSISRFYHVPLWSDAHFEIIDSYFASVAELGQKVLTVIAAEIPWSGQHCYRVRANPSYMFEHSMIQVTRDEAGQLHFDYRALDRLISLAAKHHIDRQIDLFGLLNVWVDEEYGFGKVIDSLEDAVRVRCVDQKTGMISYLRSEDELRVYIRALHDHFIALGLIDRVRVAADEPADLELFRRKLAFVRAAGPQFQYSVAINHFEFIEDAPEEVIDFIPILPLAVQDPELTANLTDLVHQKNGKMSYYVCPWPPIPNTFLHSPLVETVLLGWLVHSLKMDGFLRWAFCLWPADPWKRVSWRSPDFAAGDLYFVMPGMDGKPVATLRYEALRMAVQVYTLICMVKDALPGDQSKALLDELFNKLLKVSSVGGLANRFDDKAERLYSIGPADYHDAHRLLLAALSG